MSDSTTIRPSTAGARLRGDETTLKVLVVGDLGVGKTTYVGTLSSISPLTTEEVITEASVPIDDLDGLPRKRTTTVAMDFGRLHLNERLVMYLFGAPGQGRFRSMVTDLAIGALGALVLVDTRRLGASYPVLALMDELGLPYAVAVNTFPDAPRHALEELRRAMDLAEHTPLVYCDARDHSSAKNALIALVTHLLTAPGGPPDAGPPAHA